MDAVELRRYELRGVMLREQERKELHQVRNFNSLIRTSEGDVKSKGEKIKGLKQEIPTTKVLGDPAERLTAIKKTLQEIKALVAERKESEKNLKNLVESRDSLIETISKIKAQSSKVTELSDTKKEEIKSLKESAFMEESTAIRGIQERIDNSALPQLADMNGFDNLPKFNDSQISQLANNSGQNFQFSDQSQEPRSAPHNNVGNTSGPNWEEIKAGIMNVESVKTDAGASVKLNINSDSGSQMKVEIEKRGERNVKVRIQSGSEIDQRKIWLKKAEIVSALEKAGYSVEAVQIGGAK